MFVIFYDTEGIYDLLYYLIQGQYLFLLFSQIHDARKIGMCIDRLWTNKALFRFLSVQARSKALFLHL